MSLRIHIETKENETWCINKESRKCFIPFDSFAHLSYLEVLGYQGAIGRRHYLFFSIALTNFYYMFRLIIF
jgi:hypothetical protein